MANFGNSGGKKQQPVKNGRNQVVAVPATFEISNGRCKVCTCPQRREVDMMLVTGWSQADVVRWLNNVHGTEDDPAPFNPKNISIHKNKHLSLQDATTRKIIEERARLEGLDVERATGFILTRTGVAQTIVQTGLQHILQGVAIPETKDVLAAMQYLDKLEGEGRDIAVDEMLFEFNTFANAVKWKLQTELGEEKADEWYQAIYEHFDKQLEDRKPKALTTGTEAAEEVIEEGEYEE